MKFQILLIFIIVSGIIGLTSCEKDAHDPDLQLSGDIAEYIPPYAIDLDYSYSISNRQLEIKPVIHFDMDYWGLRIDEVEYFFDNKYFATKKAPDYTIRLYSSATGAHIISAKFIISGETINTTTFTTSKTINLR